MVEALRLGVDTVRLSFNLEESCCNRSWFKPHKNWLLKRISAFAYCANSPFYAESCQGRLW